MDPRLAAAGSHLVGLRPVDVHQHLAVAEAAAALEAPLERDGTRRQCVAVGARQAQRAVAGGVAQDAVEIARQAFTIPRSDDRGGELTDERFGLDVDGCFHGESMAGASDIEVLALPAVEGSSRGCHHRPQPR